MGMLGRGSTGLRVQWMATALLLSACSIAPAEPAPEPTVVESTEPRSSLPSSAPSTQPRDERCAHLLEVVDEIHADPHNVQMPQPFYLSYRTKLDPTLGDPHPYGAQLGNGIKVWPRLHEDDEALVFTILHEIAHLYDNACLGNSGRGTWLEARGMTRPWSTGDPFDSPDEDFADAWAVCQGADPGEWRTSVGEPPTEDECGLVGP